MSASTLISPLSPSSTPPLRKPEPFGVRTAADGEQHCIGFEVVAAGHAMRSVPFSSFSICSIVALNRKSMPLRQRDLEQPVDDLLVVAAQDQVACD